MTDLQKTEFNILVSFISACDRLGLKYYLLGGTLLGAVRHRGFIPWDDDIDVGMLRADYEVFLHEGQKLLPESYFLQTFDTDPDYPQCFAKLRDSGTTFIETSVRHRKINHGVYIDIFPLDYYPEKTVQQRLLRLKLRALFFRQRSEFYLPEYNKVTLNSLLFGPLSRALFPTTQSIVRNMDQTFRSVSESTLVCNYCGAWGEREIVPANWFANGVYGVFEGLPVRLPAVYDKYLTNIYGDYMQLPPEHKRVAHHYTQCVVLNRSFRDYQK